MNCIEFNSLIKENKWNSYFKVKLLTGDPEILLYLDNFDYFMNEIKLSYMNKVHKEYKVTNDEYSGQLFYMKSHTMYRQGSIKIYYKDLGIVVFTQVSNFMYIKLVRKGEKE